VGGLENGSWVASAAAVSLRIEIVMKANLTKKAGLGRRASLLRS
jgi:hypothetical protein